MTTNKPTTTPHSYRLGMRQEDYFVRLSPYDYMLTEVGRLRHLGREYVVLRHDRTGDLYARDINGSRLIRAFRA
jgi:hypothetical protein